MVEPNDIVLGGWDISGLNMAEAMERAAVLDFELQRQLVPYMRDITPLPGGWQWPGGRVAPARRCAGACPFPATQPQPCSLRPQAHPLASSRTLPPCAFEQASMTPSSLPPTRSRAPTT